MKNLIVLTRLIKHARGKLIGIVIFTILTTILSLVRPYIFKLVIDQLTALSTHQIAINEFTSSIYKLIIIFLATSLAFAFLDAISYKITALTNNFIGVELVRKSFDKLSTLSTDFFESQRIGETIEKVNSGINAYSSWMDLVTNQIIDPMFFCLAVVGIFLVKLPVVGLISLVFIGIYTMVIVITGKRARPIHIKTRAATEKARGIYAESFINIATLRTIGSIKDVRRKFNKSLDDSVDYFGQSNRIWYWSILTRGTLTQIFIAIVIVFLAIGGFTHQLSSGDVVFYLLILQQVIGRIQFAGRFINQTNIANITTGRLVELFDAKPTLPDSPNAEELLKLYSIEFKNVSFTYPKSKKGAIEDVSFKIEPGKTVALVGPSGVGKSTITKLLLRFYAPDSGQILINGEDIGTFTQESLRSHLGMVMQDVALFNTTVEENLKLAKTNATKDQIRAAATQAHAAEFIDELPKKYRTIVGERGIKLSGGQKQRVAIARAILKDPNLIILDEATSALDSQSERLVQAGLKKLMSGRSALVIAHRLSTVMHADEIIVLKKGRVTERGDHKDLMKQDGLYAKLFKLQSSSGQVKL